MTDFDQPSIFSDIILYNYQNQPAWNEFPSSHIAFPWLILRMISQKNFKKITLLFSFYFLLLAASVIAIKIHFIIDIFGGIIVAELVYRLVFKRIEEYSLLYKIQSKNILFFSLISYSVGLVMLGLIKRYFI